MKRIGLLLAASLFINVAVAKSTQLELHENLEVIFDQERSQISGGNSSYNYFTNSMFESIGMIQKIQLSPRVFAGLGLLLGGLEIELKTGPSVVQFEENEIDLNRWLGARAKIEFADITPFGNLAYRYQSRNTRLRISANAGLKLLQLSSVSLEFNGELGDQVNRRLDLVSALEQDVLNQLENYYLEPVLGVDLNYKFN